MRSGAASDVVLTARRCYTLAPRQPGATALAVNAGRIVAVGTPAAVRARAGRRARLVDLRECVITPGLVDCHTHFFYWALQRALVINVTNLPTLEATLARIREQAKSRTVGGWVLAAAFDHNRWGRPFPDAATLDRAVPDRPAMVRSRDAHTVWLNTLGLKRAGIDRRTADPPGGCYHRDRHGRPTGIVQEIAIDQLPNPLRDLGLRADAQAWAQVDRALEEAYSAAWALGIVGVHCVDDAASLFHFQRHRQEGRLGIRIVHTIPLAGQDHAAALGLRSGLGDDWLRIGGVKIFADGSLGAQTAYMFEPYPNRRRYRGVPVLTGEALREAVVRLAQRGWAAWIHAIGDRAVHDAIAAIAAARRVERSFLPHRIEHAQCVRPADIKRMARLRIIASVQPCHIPGDIATADRHWPRARRYAYPLRGMLDAGVTLAAGSDAPIESLDPRRGFFAAICRTDDAGLPPGGWFPRQRIEAVEVLRAFTAGAAAAAGLGPPWGRLTPGAPADLTIWCEDPLTTPPERLREVGIAGCMVGGRLHLREDAGVGE